MGKYATISVPVEVKRALEKAKGESEWGNFLFSLYAEVERLRRKAAFEQLTNTLSEKDLKSVIKSSKEFRERFTFR